MPCSRLLLFGSLVETGSAPYPQVLLTRTLAEIEPAPASEVLVRQAEFEKRLLLHLELLTEFRQCKTCSCTIRPYTFVLVTAEGTVCACPNCDPDSKQRGLNFFGDDAVQKGRRTSS